MLHEVLSLFTGWLEWSSWQNRIEVALLFAVIYLFLEYLRGSRGERIIKALGLFLVVILVGLVQLVRFLELSKLEFLLDALINTMLIAFVVLFQPELRRGLVRLGSRNPFLVRGMVELDLVDCLVTAALKFSRVRVGALCVIERQTGLGATIESGTRLDARVSPALLATLFFPGTALHDGAVIIRGDRIMAAGCLLPLSEGVEMSRALGTRHRAAVGMSEESDAVVLVVSEETGAVSIAVNGVLERRLEREPLRARLDELLFEQPRADPEEAEFVG